MVCYNRLQRLEGERRKKPHKSKEAGRASRADTQIGERGWASGRQARQPGSPRKKETRTAGVQGAQAKLLPNVPIRG